MMARAGVGVVVVVVLLLLLLCCCLFGGGVRRRGGGGRGRGGGGRGRPGGGGGDHRVRCHVMGRRQGVSSAEAVVVNAVACRGDTFKLGYWGAAGQRGA